MSSNIPEPDYLRDDAYILFFEVDENEMPSRSRSSLHSSTTAIAHSLSASQMTSTTTAATTGLRRSSRAKIPLFSSLTDDNDDEEKDFSADSEDGDPNYVLDKNTKESSSENDEEHCEDVICEAQTSE